MRGRLASIEMVSYTSGPLLGHAQAGTMAALLGTPPAIVTGGMLCLVGLAACALLLPRFVRYDARAFPHPLPPAAG